MFVLDQITINFNDPGERQRIYATVLDDGTRAVEVKLVTNDGDWAIPEGVSCVIRFMKADGHKGVYYTLPDGSSAWRVSGSTVTLKLASQVLTCPGLVEVSAALVHGTESLGIFGFDIHVAHDPLADLEESSDYFTLDDLEEINAAIAGLTSKLAVDASLSISGQPADAAAVGAGLKAVKPISQGGTNATYAAKARQQLKTPFSTSLYVVSNTASFIIVGDNYHARTVAVKAILAHQSGYLCEVIFLVNTQTGAPVGTSFIRWGNLGISSILYETTDNQTKYTITVSRAGAYAFGSLTFDNTYAVKTTADHSDEYTVNMDAYITFSDLTEGTALTEATLV